MLKLMSGQVVGFISKHTPNPKAFWAPYLVKFNFLLI